MSNTPDYEWESLYKFLAPLVEQEIRRFAAAHPDEEFYGFFFDCNSEYGDVLLCVNSEQGLDEQVDYYKRSWPDRYADTPATDLKDGFRWNPGDWKYQGFESSEFQRAFDPMKDEVMEVID